MSLASAVRRDYLWLVRFRVQGRIASRRVTQVLYIFVSLKIIFAFCGTIGGMRYRSHADSVQKKQAVRHW